MSSVKKNGRRRRKKNGELSGSPVFKRNQLLGSRRQVMLLM